MDTRAIYEQCVKEEEELQFVAFTQTDALQLGNLLYEKSKSFKKPVAIEIRMNHLTVFSFYPSGTNANNMLWLRAKAKTVDMTQHSSLRFWTDVQLSGSTAEEKRMPETEYACCGGGFPLTIKGVGVIGTICVSGLPHTDDHKVIIEALTDYLK